MAVAAEGSELRLGVSPALDEVRALAAEHNLVPVRHTFLEDCETPVSAFLKLRGAARRSCSSPPSRASASGAGRSWLPAAPGRALEPRRRRRPVRARGRRGQRQRQAPLPEPAAVRGRRGRLLRL